MNYRITAAVILLAPLFIQAQVLSWDTPLDVAPMDAGSLRPRIALNASGDPVVVWARSSSEGFFAAVAMDGSFMPPIRLNPEGTEFAAADWQGPAIAGSGDNLWAVYKGLPEDTAPCYLVGSTDGGLTWGDTLRVDPYDGLVSRFPVVAAKEDGSPIVEYMQFTSGYLEPRHVVLTWMGGSFMAPVQVSAPFAPGEVCDCCTGEVAASGNNVVALYRNAGGNIRTIWGAASGNAGMSFPVGAQLDATNWSLAACPSSGPDSYLAGDSVYYVWMSGEENGNKVYLGSAHAGTLLTGVQVNAHPGQVQSVQQNYPRIAGSGDTLGVVWEQFSGGQREILFASSTTGPTGLGAPDTVNTDLAGAQKTPDIAYANGAFHIVWSEPVMGHVRYRRAVVGPTSAVVPIVSSVLRTWYDVTTHRLHFQGIAPRTLRLIDQSGRTLLSRTMAAFYYDVGTLTAGAYLATVVDASGLSRTLTFVVP